MNEKSSAKQKPAFRINFAPRFEKDGSSQLGRSTEVGAAWKLRDSDGYRLSFNVVPQNLSDGVLFLNPEMNQDQQAEPDSELEQE